MEPKLSEYRDDQLEALIRRATREITDPQSLPDRELTVRCQEEVLRSQTKRLGEPTPPDRGGTVSPSRPEKTRSGRWRFLLGSLARATSVLLVGYLILEFGRGISEEFERIELRAKPAGMSGATTRPDENRFVVLTVPGLRPSSFAGSDRGYLVAVEFTSGQAPCVWPDRSRFCPSVFPNAERSLGKQPFSRPVSGEKWVIVVVTDRPAADTLAGLIAAPNDLGSPHGPEYARRAVVEVLRRDGYRVFAVGTYSLEPLPLAPGG